MEHTELYQMVKSLISVSEEAWGMYAFSREILRSKISGAEQREMVAASIRCGNEFADQIHMEYYHLLGTADEDYSGHDTRSFTGKPIGHLTSIVQHFGLSIEYGEGGAASDRILFALFTLPKQITIMREPYHRVFNLLRELAAEGLTEIMPDQLMDILIGHELFHYIEHMNHKEIYTRTRKIKLWSLPFYTYYSTIQTLSEIAGMNFTKRLNQLTFSPYLLDVLLIYGYNPEKARKMCQDILALRRSGS